MQEIHPKPGSRASWVRPPAYRFWIKVDVRSENECWNWIGGLDAKGYGCFYWNGDPQPTTRAHRRSWLLHNGPIPPGLCVCHRCDNPRCVNPNHLFLGTHADNAADKVSKGRQARKLSDGDIRQIRLLRERGARHRELARSFGVCETTVVKICRRERWGHVE